MKYLFALLCGALFLILACTHQPEGLSFSTDTMELRLDEKGRLSHLLDRRSGENWLTRDTIAPLLSLRVDGELLLPESLEVRPEGGCSTYLSRME